MPLQVIVPEGKMPLYCHYEEQEKPQFSYVKLQPEAGILTAEYNTDIGNAVPLAASNSRIFLWAVPERISSENLRILLEEIRPLAEQLCAGYSREFNGTDFVGQLTGKARETYGKIEEICQNALKNPDICLHFENCEYFLAFSSLQDVWPAGQTLEEAARNQNELAERENIILSGEIEEALIDKLIMELENDMTYRATEEQEEAIRKFYPERCYLLDYEEENRNLYQP